MTREEIEKEIFFGNQIIGTINHVEMPRLIYEEEKSIVKKALSQYISNLESELRGR